MRNENNMDNIGQHCLGAAPTCVADAGRLTRLDELFALSELSYLIYMRHRMRRCGVPPRTCGWSISSHRATETQRIVGHKGHIGHKARALTRETPKPLSLRVAMATD